MESPFKGGRLRVFSADYIVVKKPKLFPYPISTYNTVIVTAVVVTQKKKLVQHEKKTPNITRYISITS